MTATRKLNLLIVPNTHSTTSPPANLAVSCGHLLSLLFLLTLLFRASSSIDEWASKLCSVCVADLYIHGRISVCVYVYTYIIHTLSLSHTHTHTICIYMIYMIYIHTYTIQTQTQTHHTRTRTHAPRTHTHKKAVGVWVADS